MRRTVYVCMHVCVCVYGFTYIYIYIYVHTRAYIHACMPTYIHVYSLGIKSPLFMVTGCCDLNSVGLTGHDGLFACASRQWKAAGHDSVDEGPLRIIAVKSTNQL